MKYFQLNCILALEDLSPSLIFTNSLKPSSSKNNYVVMNVLVFTVQHSSKNPLENSYLVHMLPYTQVFDLTFFQVVLRFFFPTFIPLNLLAKALGDRRRNLKEGRRIQEMYTL